MAQKNKGYALALFSLATEKNLSDKIYNELFELNDAFENNPVYIEMLSSPAISKENKLKLLSEIFPQDYTDEVKSFLSVMCKKGDVCELSQCFKEYEQLYKEANKISVAHIKSAVELTEDEISSLKKALEARSGKRLDIDLSVDKSLLGGVYVEIDGCVFDGSLRNRLDQIKKVIE